MKRDEQHKLVLSLRGCTAKMTGGDKELFAMLLKRDRDDEDLDAHSLHQLRELHGRYVTKGTKEDLEARWKKLSGG